MEVFPDILFWYLVFLLSTTLHEASHAFFAMKLGDLTAYHNGQVTLNPIPHIKQEPIGTVVVPFISFFLAGWMIGWASAPYNLKWAYDHPKKAGIMAAAGPFSNLLLVVIAGILIHIGIALGYFYQPDSITISSIVQAYDEGIGTSLASMVSILFSLNLILFIFNLIPIPPLDGSGMVTLYLSDKNSRKYMSFIHNSAFAIFGILIAWKIFDWIYFKIHLIFINFLYWGSGYH
ncbi:MAG: site-2 protease family protein [Ignavibacteriae bacterium]|nr:site-2 protease family protein [Ignavibacteriota bacterium]NOH00079.1 site-2 protease family protein [Ignavibacteriota bacterium]